MSSEDIIIAALPLVGVAVGAAIGSITTIAVENVREKHALRRERAARIAEVRRSVLDELHPALRRIGRTQSLVFLQDIRTFRDNGQRAFITGELAQEHLAAQLDVSFASSKVVDSELRKALESVTKLSNVLATIHTEAELNENWEDFKLALDGAITRAGYLMGTDGATTSEANTY